MLSTPIEMRALQRAADVDLEARLAAVEQRLSALGTALRDNDAPAIEREAAELHRALAAAIDHFSLAARSGAVPLPLRQRLALAGGQVAAQREALARATAALDRAIDVLLPSNATAGTGSLYGIAGASDRNGRTGSVVA